MPSVLKHITSLLPVYKGNTDNPTKVLGGGGILLVKYEINCKDYLILSTNSNWLGQMIVNTATVQELTKPEYIQGFFQGWEGGGEEVGSIRPLLAVTCPPPFLGPNPYPFRIYVTYQHNPLIHKVMELASIDQLYTSHIHCS